MPEPLEYPQPLGVFGIPAGLMLIPGGEQTRSARADLVAGRRPKTWPEQLRGQQLVHTDDDAALSAITGDDPVARYNRWLLDPDSATLSTVRAGLPAQVAPLVDVAAHTLGLGPAPDPTSLDAEAVAAEVQALVLAAAASADVQSGRGDEAVAKLLSGAVRAQSAGSPVLAAVLRGSAGVLMQDLADLAGASKVLGEAVDGLAGTDLGEVRAELRLRLGSIAQEQAASGVDAAAEGALLRAAMQHYYEGLQQVSEESEPVLWASLTMNLATAHLAVPMNTASDQLRLGVATQGLRACRRVFTPQQFPQQWATATLNLANALVYTPSTHQGDNLVEAVELYEEVLASGVRDGDPLGRARLLANQGNVLAHLGAFEAARAKLVEARFAFEERLDHDGASTVRSLLDELARTEASAKATPDGADELAELARQAERMSRMPQGTGTFTSGMGVSRTPNVPIVPGPDAMPPPRPKVTVVDPSTRPTAGPR